MGHGGDAWGTIEHAQFNLSMERAPRLGLDVVGTTDADGTNQREMPVATVTTGGRDEVVVATKERVGGVAPVRLLWRG